MSVNSETYVILGVNRIADYEKDKDGWYEKYEDVMFDTRKVRVGDRGLLFDGMNTDYALFGQVLAFGTEYEGVPLTQIDFAKLLKPITETTEWLVGQNILEVPTLYVVTHYH